MDIMNVEFPESTREFVEQQVAQGGFNNVSEYCANWFSPISERKSLRRWRLRSSRDSTVANPRR